ncbi:hypothetical protein ACVWWP_005039 [Bradyrhizobium sp. LM3.6]
MHQIQLIRSSTFLWALAVAAAFALFVAGLFAFIYWKLDDYLVARSDRMIATQIHFIADLPAGSPHQRHRGSSRAGFQGRAVRGTVRCRRRQACRQHRPRAA